MTIKICTNCHKKVEIEEPAEKYDCELCMDTGEIEIMGGYDGDEWGVVDVKMCSCMED